MQDRLGPYSFLTLILQNVHEQQLNRDCSLSFAITHVNADMHQLRTQEQHAEMLSQSSCTATTEFTNFSP